MPSPLPKVCKLASAPPHDRTRWRDLGMAEIRAGAVAFVMLAGGQGTRLGSLIPKGLYGLTPPPSPPACAP